MALTKENGYSALSTLYTGAKSQKDLSDLGITESSLEKLAKEGFILNIDKTHSAPIYKLTKQGQELAEQIALEHYNCNGKINGVTA